MLEEDTIRKDFYAFNTLCDRLTNYLKSAQTKKIDEKSPAARVFDAIIKNGSFEDIYTFNYTNLQIIADSLNLGKIYFKYVHGSLENNDIIVGIDDHEEILRSYDFYLRHTINIIHHHLSIILCKTPMKLSSLVIH